MICTANTTIDLHEEVVVRGFPDATLKYDTKDTLFFKPRTTRDSYLIIRAHAGVNYTIVVVPMLSANILNSKFTIQKESLIADDKQVIFPQKNEALKQQPHLNA